MLPDAELEANIKLIARSLASGDAFLVDDLYQTMYEVLLRSADGHTGSWYIKRAEFRAKDYLRRERKYRLMSSEQMKWYQEEVYGIYDDGGVDE